jgi:hypothetical protein
MTCGPTVLGIHLPQVNAMPAPNLEADSVV